MWVVKASRGATPDHGPAPTPQPPVLAQRKWIVAVYLRGVVGPLSEKRFWRCAPSHAYRRACLSATAPDQASKYVCLCVRFRNKNMSRCDTQELLRGRRRGGGGGEPTERSGARAVGTGSHPARSRMTLLRDHDTPARSMLQLQRGTVLWRVSPVLSINWLLNLCVAQTGSDTSRCIWREPLKRVFAIPQHASSTAITTLYINLPHGCIAYMTQR